MAARDRRRAAFRRRRRDVGVGHGRAIRVLNAATDSRRESFHCGCLAKAGSPESELGSLQGRSRAALVALKGDDSLRCKPLGITATSGRGSTTLHVGILAPARPDDRAGLRNGICAGVCGPDVSRYLPGRLTTEECGFARTCAA